MKKIKIALITLLALSSVLICSCTQLSGLFGPQTQVCTVHKDLNRDNVCDTCGSAIPVNCKDHKDTNHDGKCDTNGCPVELAVFHTDTNHDGICDAENCTFTLEVVHSDVNNDGFCDVCSAAVEKAPCATCTDANNDGKCDVCGRDVEKEPCDECVDANKDGKCDVCGGEVEVKCDCVDANFDGKCDVCKNKMEDALALISNGATEYSFVIANGSGSANIKAMEGIIKELKAFGIITKKLDDEISTLSDYEILLGTVASRGEEFAYDIHTLGPEGYAIRIIGNKIQVVGGSEKGLTKGIEALRTEIFGITDSTKALKNRYVYSSQSVLKIQDNFRITSLSVNGTDMRGFTIAVDQTHKDSLNAAKNIQTTIYDYTGYWFDIVDLADADKSIVIELVEKSGNEGFYARISGNEIRISCEFQSKLYEKSVEYIDRQIKIGSGDVDFTSKMDSTVNIRDVYYKDFGAVGDGKTDDYDAIKLAHDYANKEHGHIVHADRGAVYYIGKGHTQSAIIKTDTYWGDATFIIDDSEIKPFVEGDYGEKTNPERQMWIFHIAPDSAAYSIPADQLPASISKGATNVGFAPGCLAIVRITNDNHKNYIRYGGNADDGASQVECVLVDADGNILEGTELMWDYETVTAIRIFPAEDPEITVTGGTFKQIYNQAPSVYTSYTRGIYITRSNSTLKNVKHRITGEGEHGAPMSGFTTAQGANNVTIENIEYDEPINFYTMGSGGSVVVMGSYEIGAAYCTNITWKDCTQVDFWRDESHTYADQGGLMGTNHCKNINFINMTVSSFDAHCGAQNINIIGGHIEHINCIGAGDIYVEGTTIYTLYQNNAINLRSDYGSLWMGNATFKDVILATEYDNYVALFAVYWYNHDFGYVASMPTKVIVDNITVRSDNGLNAVRLAHGNATLQNFPIWETEVPNPENLDTKIPNKNPYMPTQEFIIRNNVNKVEFIIPESFKGATNIIYEE